MPSALSVIEPTRLLGEPIGVARFKTEPDDFQVEEMLGFVPSGEGEHCLVWIEKLGRTTNDVVTEFANRLGIRKRLISHCGLKDKYAVTRQWISLHLPGQKSPTEQDLEMEGLRVLRITRNLRKLHRGSHDSNRFLIRLRNCTFTPEAAAKRWQQIVEKGAPNYFGKQRFGRDGGNVQQAHQYMSGELTVKDHFLRGILISTARSVIFNACLAERVDTGTWDRPLPGEVFGFTDNRSLVLPTNLRGDEAARYEQGSLELTAPLWGQGELQSEGDVRQLEERVAGRYQDMIDGLAQFNLRQERRVIRLKPSNPELSWLPDASLVIRFELPKGTYATTLLRELADLQERN